MTNKLVARQLRIAGDLLVLTGGNAFRARAFSSASRTVDRMDEPVAGFDVQELTTVRGIGKGLAADIREIIETGTLGVTESMLQSLPPGLPEVMRVKGLGPKKVRTLWQDLDIESLDDLEQAAASGALEALPGFGAKTVANILASIEALKAYRGLAHYAKVVPEALAVREALRATGARADLTGAVRRQCNVVDGADLVTDASSEAIAAALSDYDLDGTVGTLPGGLPLRLHLSPEASYGTHLWRTTGSDAHLSLWRERFG
ncbi:MAG: helix-hairpin-helix domain-containing protein, partial [Bacteroidota bacterium]